MKNRRIMGSAFFSYLRLFLMLALSIIVLFGGAQYVLSYRIMKETALESSRNSLLLLTNTHEMILSQADDSISALMENTDLIDYLDYFRRNLHNTCRSMINQLASVAQGNRYIQSICIYYWQDAYSLSSDFGPASLEWYYDAAFCRALREQKNPQGSVYRRQVKRGDQEAQVLTLVRSMPVFTAIGTPKAYMIVNLNVEAIIEALQLASGCGNSMLLVVDGTGNVIAQSGMNQETAAYVTALFDNGEAGGTGSAVVWKEEMLVQTMRTSRGWTYYFIQPMHAVMGGISRLQNTILAVCALTLLVSVALSLLFSRRAYAPIQTISNRFEAVFSDEETANHQRVQDIISRVDSVIAHNRQLEDEWQRSVSKNHELCFWQLVHDEAPSSEQYAEWMQSLGVGPDSGIKRLLIASEMKSLPAQATEEWNALLRRWSMRTLAMFYPRDEYAVMLVACATGTSQAEADRTIACFLRAHGAAAVGISDPFESGEEIRSAWYQGMKQCGLRTEAPKEVLLWEISIENDLLRAIKNQDAKAVRNALNAFLLHLIRRDADIQAVRGAYQRIYDVVSHLNGETPCIPAQQEGMHGTMMELDQGLETLCNSIMAQMAPQEKAISSLSRDVCAYIDANLCEDLSIERLAERFHLSASNLRRVFRGEIGMTPKEYLDRQRVSMAKRMLREQDLQIQQIACQLGFQYSQSFIAFFRSMEGITPGEYRARETEEKMRTDHASAAQRMSGTQVQPHA